MTIKDMCSEGHRLPTIRPRLFGCAQCARNSRRRQETEARHRARMKSPAEIRNRLVLIDADERYHYKSALVQVNAPLALIQQELETEASALAWVLGVKPPRPGPRKRRRS